MRTDLTFHQPLHDRSFALADNRQNDLSRSHNISHTHSKAVFHIYSRVFDHRVGYRSFTQCGQMCMWLQEISRLVETDMPVRPEAQDADVDRAVFGQEIVNAFALGFRFGFAVERSYRSRAKRSDQMLLKIILATRRVIHRLV